MLSFASVATAALSLLAATPCLAAVAGSVGPTAIIADGIIIGTTAALPKATAVVNQFLGIPYAAPPQRFAPPKKPTAWWSPLDASKRKASCMQQFSDPDAAREVTIAIFSTPLPQESEDCLYLNVFAPSTLPPLDGYPVIFWTYGGALQFGNAGQPGYDGSAFAAFEDTIVVTYNYRTNVFGFPNSPELAKTAQNLGFLDQRLALDWVQRNIASFGGNPKKVTLAGESAGAMSTDLLVVTTPQNPPFRAAILQSGTAGMNKFMSKGNSTVAWGALAAALNCTTTGASQLACLRAVPALSIKAAIETAALGFNPVDDGVTFVSDPDARRAARNVARVPILAGTNAEEGKAFTIGENSMDNFLATMIPVPALAASIKAAYPVGSQGISSEADAVAAVFTDLVFACPQATSASLTAAADIPTWRYHFNATFPNLQPLPGMDLGVFHSIEIGLVFATYPAAGATAAEIALSTYMRAAWARFARNPAAGPGWNALGSGPQDVAVLGGEGWAGVRTVAKEELDSKCKVFAPIYGAA